MHLLDEDTHGHGDHEVLRRHCPGGHQVPTRHCWGAYRAPLPLCACCKTPSMMADPYSSRTGYARRPWALPLRPAAGRPRMDGSTAAGSRWHLVRCRLLSRICTGVSLGGLGCGWGCQSFGGPESSRRLLANHLRHLQLPRMCTGPLWPCQPQIKSGVDGMVARTPRRRLLQCAPSFSLVAGARERPQPAFQHRDYKPMTCFTPGACHRLHWTQNVDVKVFVTIICMLHGNFEREPWSLGSPPKKITNAASGSNHRSSNESTRRRR